MGPRPNIGSSIGQGDLPLGNGFDNPDPIGFVVSSVLMALVFYGIITPVGLVFRVLRRDPLNRRFDGNTGSYWVPHHQVEELERYFKQF